MYLFYEELDDTVLMWFGLSLAAVFAVGYCFCRWQEKRAKKVRGFAEKMAKDRHIRQLELCEKIFEKLHPVVQARSGHLQLFIDQKDYSVSIQLGEHCVICSIKVDLSRAYYPVIANFFDKNDGRRYDPEYFGPSDNFGLNWCVSRVREFLVDYAFNDDKHDWPQPK